MKSKKMIHINNLHCEVQVSSGEAKPILKGLSLDVPAGEVHAIMGPNGSGKSTLSYAVTGRDGYDITDGSIDFLGESMLDLPPEERASRGIYLSFQYPIEIPGVPTLTFLRETLNAQKKSRGEDEVSAPAFIKLAREKAKQLDISMDMLKRPVNVGFSGGEKKRLEILQALILEPKFLILDETDSGLDIDALKTVSEGVNTLRSPDVGMLVITHYQRLLDYIKPDVVHVMSAGRIVKSGGPELALELEAGGYDQYVGEVA
jgi:Fe-S cluster assembly ATP-binding protein